VDNHHGGDRNARPAPDLVERNFVAPGPNRLWVADITYIPTWAGFLYLAVMLDAFSRRIVGWAMETHLRTELVHEALNMALAQRLPAGVIHHSDQGNGLSRRLLRQCDVRELFRYARMRAARPRPLPHSGRGPHGGVRVHRGLV
jgi:transposase InsO family protein